jgi:outer membrane lipoprotein carrier protein
VKRIQTFILAVAIVFLTNLPVLSQDTAELMRNIDEQQKKIQTLQADFSQKRETALAKKPLISSGTVKFKRPDRVRWAYARPERVDIASNGKEIWLYYPQRGQAERYLLSRGKRLAQYMEPLMSIFEKPFAQLASEYDVTYQGRAGSVHQFRLRPKRGKVQEVITQVDLGIDSTSGAIVTLTVAETSGDRLTLEFKKMQINLPLSEDDLDVKMSPSTRVQDQSLP